MKNQTIKIWIETVNKLRMIYALTGEKMTETLDRLVCIELEKVRKEKAMTEQDILRVIDKVVYLLHKKNKINLVVPGKGSIEVRQDLVSELLDGIKNEDKDYLPYDPRIIPTKVELEKFK